MPRPDRLPQSAVRVVLWSRILPAKAKLVWWRDYWLDQGPDGAWISGAVLADELALDRKYVEKVRAFLVRAGLHERQGGSGRRGAHWFCTLPRECIPPARGKVSDAVIAQYGARLDAHLRAQMPPSRAAQREKQMPPSEAALTADVGGQQGGSFSTKGTEVPSSSEDTVPEERRKVATLPNAEEEKERWDKTTLRAMETFAKKRVAR